MSDETTTDSAGDATGSAQSSDAPAADIPGAEAAGAPVDVPAPAEAPAADQPHETHETHHASSPMRAPGHIEIHPHVRWHADILVEGHDIYHGFVRDVSETGAELYLDHNLQKIRHIRLHIHVPPLVVTPHPHVLDVYAKIASTVYDSDEECFRSSLIFVKFTQDSDLAYLRSRLQ